MTQKFNWIAVSILLGSGTILLSQSNEGPKPEEYLLLGNANPGAGEPIVIAMATLNRLPSGEAPSPEVLRLEADAMRPECNFELRNCRLRMGPAPTSP